MRGVVDGLLGAAKIVETCTSHATNSLNLVVEVQPRATIISTRLHLFFFLPNDNEISGT